jgi:ABC-type branched-subunit amino acid transport system substrate-binding protein
VSVRSASALLVVGLLAGGCTGGGSRPTPAPGTSTLFEPMPAGTGTPGVPPVVLDVVAAITPGSAPSAPLSEEANDRSYLDGMRFAAAELNAGGGIRGRPVALAVHDDGGDVAAATKLMGSLVAARPTAMLYVGPGTALPPLRLAFEQARTPVALLEGDVYTSRQAFPQVFQTTLPWAWQAHVIARYLVVDRTARQIVFVGAGPEAPVAEAETRAALAYWGGSLAAGFTMGPFGQMPSAALAAAAKADAVVDFGTPVDSATILNAIREQAGSSGGPKIAGSSALLAPPAGLARPSPGTAACYAYTWSGWAQPIPRVGTFDRDFAAFAGHPPAGLEQEGYDAVRALAAGLTADGLRGGDALVTALEGIHNSSYSSFPVTFGPDAHEFLPRDQLGLFAVAGPDEKLDPWQPLGSEPWRPVMRTFTYDGQRDDILNSDKTVFFPGWTKQEPGPWYWQSRYGIVTKYGRDPLH